MSCKPSSLVFFLFACPVGVLTQLSYTYTMLCSPKACDLMLYIQDNVQKTQHFNFGANLPIPGKQHVTVLYII